MFRQWSHHDCASFPHSGFFLDCVTPLKVSTALRELATGTDEFTLVVNQTAAHFLQMWCISLYRTARLLSLILVDYLPKKDIIFSGRTNISGSLQAGCLDTLSNRYTQASNLGCVLGTARADLEMFDA